MNELIKLWAREASFNPDYSGMLSKVHISDQLGHHRTRPSAGITDPIAVCWPLTPDVVSSSFDLA